MQKWLGLLGEISHPHFKPSGLYFYSTLLNYSPIMSPTFLTCGGSLCGGSCSGCYCGSLLFSRCGCLRRRGRRCWFRTRLTEGRKNKKKQLDKDVEGVEGVWTDHEGAHYDIYVRTTNSC